MLAARSWHGEGCRFLDAAADKHGPNLCNRGHESHIMEAWCITGLVVDVAKCICWGVCRSGRTAVFAGKGGVELVCDDGAGYGAGVACCCANVG